MAALRAPIATRSIARAGLPRPASNSATSALRSASAASWSTLRRPCAQTIPANELVLSRITARDIHTGNLVAAGSVDRLCNPMSTIIQTDQSSNRNVVGYMRAQRSAGDLRSDGVLLNSTPLMMDADHPPLSRSTQPQKHRSLFGQAPIGTRGQVKAIKTCACHRAHSKGTHGLSVPSPSWGRFLPANDAKKIL